MTAPDDPFAGQPAPPDRHSVPPTVNAACPPVPQQADARRLEIDGFSVASVVIGAAIFVLIPFGMVIVGPLVLLITPLGAVPLALGIVGVVRTARSGRDGRSMAVTGIVLGGISTLLARGIAFLLAMALFIASAAGLAFQDWHAECVAGDAVACDEFSEFDSPGQKYDGYGRECDVRGSGVGDCASPGPLSDDTDEGYPDGGGTGGSSPDWDGDGYRDGSGDEYGEDPELDALWNACGAGELAACDELYVEAPLNSEYEDFGWECGWRGSKHGDCSGLATDRGRTGRYGQTARYRP